MTKKQTQVVYDAHGNPIEVDSAQFGQAVVGQADTSQLQPAVPRPPVFQAQQPTQNQGTPIVYMARPHELEAPVISEEVKQKHNESRKKFPYLNLSEGEYVISAVRRHPIGVLAIWAVVGAAILLLVVGIVTLMSNPDNLPSFISAESLPSLAMFLLGAIVFVFLGGVLATVVYNGNRFFLTNESVTQHIQMSLFSKKEQTVSLTNIEDASFRQHGILQTFLNYGSLRLSTQGDETTYRFNFVENPATQVAVLNNAVEAFKMGRPVDDND